MDTPGPRADRGPARAARRSGRPARRSASATGGELMPTDVVRWNNAALEAIRQTHTGPPIVARPRHPPHLYVRRLGRLRRARGGHTPGRLPAPAGRGAHGAEQGDRGQLRRLRGANRLLKKAMDPQALALDQPPQTQAVAV